MSIEELKPNEPVKIVIDINKIPEWKCSSCGGTVIEQGFKLKIVPALQSRTGKPDPLTANIFFCAKCRKEVPEITNMYVSLLDQLKKQLQVTPQQQPSILL
jgi:hypothetical protein